MQTDILTPAQLAVLERLRSIPAVREFYLAGGTALALRHGHRYGTHRTDRYHRLRALAYFDDTEREPMPDMLVPLDWEEAKRFFTAEATRLLSADGPPGP